MKAWRSLIQIPKIVLIYIDADMFVIKVNGKCNLYSFCFYITEKFSNYLSLLTIEMIITSNFTNFEHYLTFGLISKLAFYLSIVYTKKT